MPCYNEAAAIQNVVRSFLSMLPSCIVYVYDNNSCDATAELAAKAGAVVRRERRQGKGHVIRRMFADVEADIYILVDGDGTYDASAGLPAVERMMTEGLDLINIARRAVEKGAYRRGHAFGNRILTGIVRRIFGREFKDMLSGFKLFSRRFVKSFPAMSSGFEIETEVIIHSLELRMGTAEMSAPYRERTVGSYSKLRTFRDGFRILRLIARLIKDERPLPFFGTLGAAACGFGITLGGPVISTYFETGLVPRLPTAVLAVAVITIGVLCFFAGLILDLASRTRHEIKRLAYLSIPAHYRD